MAPENRAFEMYQTHPLPLDLTPYRLRSRIRLWMEYGNW